MTRDHYKGIPKTRDAVITADGSIVPLSNRDEAGYIPAVDFFRIDKSDVETIKHIYARATGDDASGDGTLAKPYRTFRRAVKDLPTISNDTMWVVDITGIGLETHTERYHFPACSSNFSQKLTFTPPVHREFYFLSAINILATPTTIDTVNITGTTTNPTTSMHAYTDSAKSWVTDEHVGRFVMGSSITEVGTIYANDGDTLYVAGSATLSSPITILEPSAELKFGPLVDSFSEGSFVIKNSGATITLGGVKFSRNSTSAGSMFIENSSNTTHTLTHFEAGVQFKNSGLHTMDAVNIETFFAQDGAGIVCRHSFMHNVPTFSNHGDGGLGVDDWLSTRFDTVGPLGHGGNAEGYSPYAYTKCSVINATSAGIDYNGGGHVKVRNTEFIDGAGNAVQATGPGTFYLAGVTGAGNAAFGLYITDGAQVAVTDSTLVTGASGDFKVGLLPPTTWTNFNSGFQAQLDTTAVSGTLSRIFNSASY